MVAGLSVSQPWGYLNSGREAPKETRPRLVKAWNLELDAPLRTRGTAAAAAAVITTALTRKRLDGAAPEVNQLKVRREARRRLLLLRGLAGDASLDRGRRRGRG